MKIFEAKTFFCCWPLETGGIVIGWLGIIFHCFFIGELFNQLEINNGGLYVFLAYCILLILISYLCIRATKARNPIPLRYIKGCLIIYALIPIEFVRENIMNGLLYEAFTRITFQLICIYFFIVIDSLSEKFFRDNAIPVTYSANDGPEQV